MNCVHRSETSQIKKARRLVIHAGVSKLDRSQGTKLLVVARGGHLATHDDDRWLREQGVDLTIEENARLRNMISVVERTWESGAEESIDLKSAQQGGRTWLIC